VPDQISRETQELLDRAQRAIDEATALRRLSRSHLKDAEMHTAMLKLATYRERAQQFRKKN